MESKLSQKVKAWDDAIRWIAILNIAFIPFLMLPFTIDAFELPKAAFLHISALFMLALFIIRSAILEEIWLGRSPLDLPVFLFVLVATIGTICSPTPLLSIIGQYARYESLPTIYSYALLYFMASRFLIGQEWITRLFKTIFYFFGLVSLYGLIQHFGFDAQESFMPFLQGTPGRISSTFGNPVFLGGYLAFLLPILLNFIIDSDKYSLLPKPILITLFSLGIPAIVLTETRGAWIGLAIGLIAVLIIRRKDLFKNISMVSISFLFAILLTIAILIIPITPRVSANSSPDQIANPVGINKSVNKIGEVKEKVASLANPNEGSIVSRIELWKSAIHMISVRPLVGFGLDQAYNWWPRFQTLKQAQLEIDTVPDRAHNEFLQVAISNGVLSLLAYLWILLALAITIIKTIRADYQNKFNSFINLALLGGFIGYFSQAFFSVSVIGLSVVLWGLFGVVSQTQAAEERKLSFAFSNSVKPWIATSVISLALILSIFSLRPIIADFYYLKAAISEYAGDLVGKANNLLSATYINPYQSLYRRDLALLYYDEAKRLSDPNLVQKGLTLVEGGLRINPNDQSLMLGMANGYRISAYLAKENSFLDSAELYYGRAVDACPNFATPRRGLLGMYIAQERYEDAIEQAIKILQITPYDNAVKYRLGLAYEKLGRIGKARRIYKEILVQNPEMQEVKDSLKRVQ